MKYLRPIALMLVLAVAACPMQPPPPDLTPPPLKLDPKTQLESSPH